MMEELLIIDEKYHKPFIISNMIIFLINIFALFLLYMNYNTKLSLMEIGEDPNYNIYGLKNFFFELDTTKNIKEYNPENPNLGNTGKPIFDCYVGDCYYDTNYGRQIKRTNYISSSSCRRTQRCKKRDCSSYEYYYFKSCECSHEINSFNYSDQKSCTADNVIYNWKNYYFIGSLLTTYNNSILYNAVPPNENCPPEKKQCGILDNLGTKLCYDKSIDCPINYITLNKTDSNYNYQSVIVDNLTIYYTNESTQTGKVVGGLFVDTDLLINYNNEDCEILTTSNISSLLYSQNNKLYQNCLDFDPYNDKDIDKKGKSYLKWCVPGHGKEKDINKIKKLKEVYETNIIANKYIVELESYFKTSYYLGNAGHFMMVFIIIVLISVFIKQNEKNQNSWLTNECVKVINIILIIFIFISISLVIISAINTSLSVYKTFEANKLNIEDNNFISFLVMNFICLILQIVMPISLIGILFFLSFVTNYNKHSLSNILNNNDKNKEEQLKQVDDCKTNDCINDCDSSPAPI